MLFPWVTLRVKETDMNIQVSLVAALSLVPSILAFPAASQIVVDGTNSGEFLTPLTVQTSTTGFGDAVNGTPDVCGGSELDNCFAAIDGGVLYLFFGGNLESNFNKFELFIDSGIGGQNSVRGDNADVDFNGLNRLGESAAGVGDGLKFDECFSANFYLTVTCGATPTALYANIAQVLTDGGGIGAYIGSGAPGTVAIDNAKYGVKVALNNSNVLGVTGDGGTTDGAATVATGIEVAIPLSLMGYDAATQQNIKVCAMINGGGHDYLSNQILGGLALGTTNLGEPRAVNLALAAGNQYAVVVVDADEPDCPVVPPSCPADFNADGTIDGADLATVLSGWGTASGDTNGDLITDGADLAAVLSAWGPCV